MGHYLYPKGKRVHNVGGSDQLPIDLENEWRAVWTMAKDKDNMALFAKEYKKSGRFDLVDMIWDDPDGAALIEHRTRDKAYSTMLLATTKFMGLLQAGITEVCEGKAINSLIYSWGTPNATFVLNLANKTVSDWFKHQVPEKLKSTSAHKNKQCHGETGFYVPRALMTEISHPPAEETPWKGDDNCHYTTWLPEIKPF